MSKINIKGGITAILLAVSLFTIPGVWAGNYKIGNYDIHGSRSIPTFLEPDLTRDNVKRNALEVKWFTQTDQPVAGVPVVYKGVVFAGTLNLFTGEGSIYAMDANTGVKKWQRTIPGGVLASPLIYNGYLYVASFAGTLYKMDRQGNIIHSYTPALSIFDSIWAGPIPVLDGYKVLIVIAINPQDEYPDLVNFGRAGVIAVDADTLQEKWTRIITSPNEGGSGVWGTSPAYSILNGLIYVGTGQTTRSNISTSASSNAVYALNVRDGSVRWKTQVQSRDIWNFSTPFDPTRPRDTDIGDSPALFFQGLKQYVAMGSKRGYFYVMDAKTGDITNKKIVSGSDTDSLGYKRTQLDAFNYSGTGVVGNSLDGGYNLDSGFYRQGFDLIHFGILFDYKANLKLVAANDGGRWPNRTCFIAGFGFTQECPPISSGKLILNNSDGSRELGRYSKTSAKLLSPLYLNDMVLMVSTNNEAYTNTNQTPISLVAVDVSNPSNPKLIQDLPLTFRGVTAISGGSMLSVSNGLIYVGNGFLGAAPSGLFAVGMKNVQRHVVDDD